MAQRYLQQIQMKQQSPGIGIAPSSAFGAYGQMLAVPTSASAAAALSSQLAASGLTLVPVPGPVVQSQPQSAAAYLTQSLQQTYAHSSLSSHHGAQHHTSSGGGGSAQSVASLAYALASPLVPMPIPAQALTHSPQKASAGCLPTDPMRDNSGGAFNVQLTLRVQVCHHSVLLVLMTHSVENSLAVSFHFILE